MPYKDPAEKAEYKKQYNKRYRQRNPEAFERGSKRYRAKVPSGAKSGQPWSAEDVEAIHAPDRPSDLELARQLGRSVTAISVKRAKTL